jgi:hypothetical protein
MNTERFDRKVEGVNWTRCEGECNRDDNRVVSLKTSTTITEMMF